MGGQLIIVPLNLDGDELMEWHDTAPGKYSFDFRYSYWSGEFKGNVLRSLIAYLEDVEKREPFSKEILLEEGLISSPTAAANLTPSNALSRVQQAIAKLKSWKREDRAERLVRPARAFGAFYGSNLMGSEEVGTRAFGLNEILDLPYDLDALGRIFSCPEELKLLKLEGIYVLLKEPDFYSYWHAQKLLFVLERIQPDDKQEFFKEFVDEFIAFLKRCGPDQRFMNR